MPNSSRYLYFKRYLFRCFNSCTEITTFDEVDSLKQMLFPKLEANIQYSLRIDMIYEPIYLKGQKYL